MESGWDYKWAPVSVQIRLNAVDFENGALIPRLWFLGMGFFLIICVKQLGWNSLAVDWENYLHRKAILVWVEN